MAKFKIFAVIVVIVAIVAGAYFYLPTNNVLSFSEWTPKLQQAVANFRIPEEVVTTTQNLGNQAQTLQTHIGAVLGASDTEMKEQPIQERAFEYGRYVYCKQVVTDYENRSSKSQ